MKKIALLLSFVVSVTGASAQITLTTPPYVQTFDGLSSGYPTGWTTYNNATSSSLGTIEAIVSTLAGLPFQISPDTTACAGLVLGGGFKNYPSASATKPGDNFCPPAPATAPTYTNRALGIRQVSPTNGTHPNLDPGAAFVLKLANTTSRTGFTASFLLQSLDTSSPRTTTWAVDYRVGETGSFTTAAASGTLTTGNKTFSNNLVTVNFGTALDNQSSAVYIRVVALTASSGSGNRPSSAIDSFVLNYTSKVGVEEVSSEPKVALQVVGAATADNINLMYTAIENATHTLSVYDLAGRIIHTETIHTQAGTEQISVNGLHLMPGMYFARLSNQNSCSVAKVMIE